MASQRMSYTPTSLIGGKLSRVAGLGAQFRQALGELHSVAEAYADDNAQLEVDLGNAKPGTAALLRNLLAQATAETYGGTLFQYPAGSATAIRQLLDQTA